MNDRRRIVRIYLFQARIEDSTADRRRMRLGQTAVSRCVLSQFHQTEIIVTGQGQSAGQTRFQVNSRRVQIEIGGELTETRRFPPVYSESARRSFGYRRTL